MGIRSTQSQSKAGKEYDVLSCQPSIEFVIAKTPNMVFGDIEMRDEIAFGVQSFAMSLNLSLETRASALPANPSF